MSDSTLAMNAAEFRVFREAHGLSGADLANLLRVDRRTIVRWEIGDTDKPGAQIPDRIVAAVRDFEQHSALFVQTVVDELQADAEPRLVTYRNDEQFWAHHPDQSPLPASWHRAMSHRIAQSVSDTRIVYADQPGAGNVAHRQTAKEDQ